MLLLSSWVELCVCRIPETSTPLLKGLVSEWHIFSAPVAPARDTAFKGGFCVRGGGSHFR